MTAVKNALWRRRFSLLVMDENRVFDLSDMHTTFHVEQEETEAPNNARIRVENMHSGTESFIRESFQRVVLQAGYQEAPYGVIFDGTIKQYAKGRTDQRTTYLDILAADGQRAYNYANINRVLPAGHTPEQRVSEVAHALEKYGVKPGDITLPHTGGIIASRPKIQYGMARSQLRQIANDQGAVWDIVNGRVNFRAVDTVPKDVAVVLSAATGLIGRAEQTEGGVTCRCLINPRIRVGTIVQLDNRSVNITVQAKGQGPKVLNPSGLPNAQQAFNRYVGVPQTFADVAADGLYRVFICEFIGDTRGQEWYQDLTLLAINPVTRKVQP